MNLEVIIKPLVKWYQENKRDLPWRREVTPYHIWVSEIMLQQTRVEAVKEYYVRFMKVLPSIHDLANVEEDRLLKLWQGLGYYNRARNLQKAAKIIEEKYHGEFPSSYLEVLSLPGIGSYTAGAILSIAFQQPLPAVDGNVLRVLSRVLGNFDDITQQDTKRKMELLLRNILKSTFVSDFNQGLMELGAMICIPNGTPKCESCPLQKHCIAYQNHLTSKLPVQREKKSRKREDKTVLLFKCQNQYAIRKRPSKGLLANMYEFPNIEGHYEETQLKEWLKQNHISYQKILSLSPQKHIFTHVEWHMIGYLVECDTKSEDYLWKDIQELDQYSIPNALQYYYPKIKND